MYMESMDDPTVIQLLKQKAASGTTVRVLLANTKKVPENKPVIAELQKAGIIVFTPKKPYIHAKIIVVDQMYLYVGSMNMTTNSMDKNREVGILFEDTAIARQVLGDMDVDETNG